MAEKNYQIEDSIAEQIFTSIATMHEAACYLLERCPCCDKRFDDIAEGLYEMSEKIIALLEEKLGFQCGEFSLTKILKSVEVTISRLQVHKKNESFQLSKIQFELIPLIEESFLHARYWLWATKSSGGEFSTCQILALGNEKFRADEAIFGGSTLALWKLLR